MPTVAVVAGEASGDTHAANLVRELRGLVPDLRVWAVGGSALAAAGAEIAYPSERIAGMGLVEAAGRLPALAEARRRVVDRFRAAPPDLFVPVDFGGLNLRLATAARRAGVPVVYYVPPKMWAWGGWRVRRLREAVDEALVILPFEEAFFLDRGVPARYVGSPVADDVGERAYAPEPDLVALLPGSRPGEVSRIWPVLLAAAKRLARSRPVRFAAAVAPGLDRALLERPLARAGVSVDLTDAHSHDLIARSRVVLAASGTVTLECALVGAPVVAVYRVSPVTYAVGRLLVRVPFFTLPNLVAGRRVIPELLQPAPEAVAREAISLLDAGPARQAVLDGLAEVRASVGGPGASRRAAEAVRDHLVRRADGL